MTRPRINGRRWMDGTHAVSLSLVAIVHYYRVDKMLKRRQMVWLFCELTLQKTPPHSFGGELHNMCQPQRRTIKGLLRRMKAPCRHVYEAASHPFSQGHPGCTLESRTVTWSVAKCEAVKIDCLGKCCCKLDHFLWFHSFLSIFYVLCL